MTRHRKAVERATPPGGRAEARLEANVLRLEHRRPQRRAMKLSAALLVVSASAFALVAQAAPRAASLSSAASTSSGAACFMQPKASGWNYKYAPGNVFPTTAAHPHGLRLVENTAACCTLCQSLKNCTFFTYSAGGTVAKPTCYKDVGKGCCFLKTAAGGDGAPGCATCTSGSTKKLAPLPVPPPPPPTPTPKFIPAHDPACWYTGRTRTNADGSRSFDWEGTQLWLNLEGASYVKMVSSAQCNRPTAGCWLLLLLTDCHSHGCGLHADHPSTVYR